jgi:hypothetical protein
MVLVLVLVVVVLVVVLVVVVLVVVLVVMVDLVLLLLPPLLLVVVVVVAPLVVAVVDVVLLLLVVDNGLAEESCLPRVLNFRLRLLWLRIKFGLPCCSLGSMVLTGRCYTRDPGRCLGAMLSVLCSEHGTHVCTHDNCG